MRCGMKLFTEIKIVISKHFTRRETRLLSSLTGEKNIAI